MESVELKVEPRDDYGKGPARRLRAAGRIPAIIYGPNRATTRVTVSNVEFERKVASLEGAHLLTLRGGGSLGDSVVLLKESQEHPLTGRILHADFLEVDLAKRVRVTVSLHFVGRAIGIVAGGIVQPVLREIDVECLPTQIPDFVEVDVTALAIHDSLHVKDLVLPSGVTVETDDAQAVVTVTAPVSEESAEATTGAADSPAVVPAKPGENDAEDS